jgi:hypothetical protein
MIRLNEQGIHIASMEGALTMSMAFDDNCLASSRFTRALADMPIPCGLIRATDVSSINDWWQIQQKTNHQPNTIHPFRLKILLVTPCDFLRSCGTACFAIAGRSGKYSGEQFSDLDANRGRVCGIDKHIIAYRTLFV